MVDHGIDPQLNIPGVGWTFTGRPPVAASVPVKVERGVSEAGEIRPSKCTFRLLDDDDRYRPSNPAGIYYGKLRQYMGGAVWINGTLRTTGEVASYKPDETNDHRAVAGVSVRGVRWVDMEIAGPLRRIGQWDDPLESAMRHQISGYASLRGYWPLEDGRDSERLHNASSNGRPGYHSGVSLGQAEGPPGSDSVLTMNTGGFFGGQFETMPVDNTGWQVFFHMNALAASGTEFPVFSWYTSDGLLWQWHQSQTTYRMNVTTRDGTVVYSNSSLHGVGAEDGQWMTVRIRATRSGSTVTVAIAWNPESDVDLVYGMGGTATYTGAASRPTSWRVASSVNNDGGAFAHVGATYGTTDDVTALEFRQAFQGYRGELAMTRYQRIMGQAGLPWQRLGFLVDGTPMGPQPIASVIEILKEIQQTEDGLVYDRRDVSAVVLKGRRIMVNQTVALALTWPTQVSGLKEITDDLGVYNDVTVDNRNGGEAQAVLETGPLSVAEIGRVRKTVNVNVDETQVDLQQLAGYYLNKFTVGGSRYSSLVVDLDAQPGLEAAAVLVEPGAIITVAGRTPDLLKLRVLGLGESATRKRRLLEFTVEPADIWAGGIYDDPGSRADARGHQITAGPFAPAAVTIRVDYTTSATADGLAWTFADGAFDIVVAGERMTVTGVAAAGAHQDLTVTRAVNGVAKTLTAGDSVRLADPARYWR